MSQPRRYDRTKGSGWSAAHPASQAETAPGEGIEALWPGYLRDGYFDEGNCLRAAYVSRVAGQQQGMDYGVEPLANRLVNSQPPLSMKQARQFFAQARRVESLLAAEADAPLKRFQQDFMQLEIVANYRFDREKNRKIPALFRDFIVRNVQAVQAASNPRDAFLRGFLPHFEALMGYLSLHRSE